MDPGTAKTYLGIILQGQAGPLVHLLFVLHDTRISDEGTAYKVFRRDFLRSLEIRARGFDFCTDITSQILKKKIPIVQVPVSYRARSSREGKKPGFRDGLMILWAIIRGRLT